jgi:cell wall-associated NlpC family hydrolase
MRRLVPLLGAVLALALASNAGADTFKVVRPHGSGGGAAVGFSSSAPAIPFTSAQKAQTGAMPFAALRGIWMAAGSTYGIPWNVLAAINKVETNFGANLGPSSAGAVGWMQFMPSTWARWGIDANGDGVADPDNPTDAIFSAARYLAGCGGQFDIARAVYCYNHATWYVNEVMGLAALYARGGSATVFTDGQLLSQIKTARASVADSKAQIAAASAKARKFAHAERRLLHLAANARLLSDQLEANKHAVQVGVRRHAQTVRVKRLRNRLRSATAQLGRMQDRADSASAMALSYGFPLGAGFGGQSNGVVSIALQYLGTPYLWAGASPVSGFDCSGLVQYVYAQLGISLPHNTVAQWHSPNAVSVPQDALQPGDLVFFDRLDHVGIYIGNGYFVDAPHTGAYVRIDSLSDGWYAAKYDGAKRIVGASLESFQPSSGGPAFSSNVVYFTH